MPVSHRDPMLRRIIAAAQTAPDTVTDPAGGRAPISPHAADKLRERLTTVAQMHLDGALTDAQLLQVVRQLVTSCEDTSVLHHMLSPEQVAANHQRVLTELCDHVAPLTDADRDALDALTAP